MQVSVRYPHGEIGAFATAVFNDQIPFATSVALNNTAKAFQQRQRDRLRDIFTIRNRPFADRSIKIKPFATKQDPEVRISVDSPRGRSDIFGKFEDETSKDPFSGNSVAVPTEHVPRNPSGTIKKAWKPRQVLNRNFRDGFRAFIRTSRSGRAIFFDERGQGLKPLYWLVPSVPIEPELEFIDTANQTVEDRWQDEFVSAFDRATLTARRR